jgi:hypothetical protein
MTVSGHRISRNRNWLEQVSGVPKRQLAEFRTIPNGFGREVHMTLTMASLVVPFWRDNLGWLEIDRSCIDLCPDFQ